MFLPDLLTAHEPPVGRASSRAAPGDWPVTAREYARPTIGVHFVIRHSSFHSLLAHGRDYAYPVVMAGAPDELHELPPPTPAPPELVERASALVRSYPECFWFRHPEARIRHLEDVRVVIEHLREYGDRRAWWVELRAGGRRMPQG